MVYKFTCPKCNKEYEIECSMSEYDNIKKEVFCDDCDILLKRKFEKFDGAIEFNCKDMYNTNYGIHAKWQ